MILKKIKDLTFEFTDDNELIIRIDRGIAQTTFIDGADLDQFYEFVNETMRKRDKFISDEVETFTETFKYLLKKSYGEK